MSKYRLAIYIAGGLFLIAAVLTLPFQVGQVQGELLSQTWPSRTPTPQGGPDPTNTSQPPPPPTDDPGNPPQNTATPQPGPTNTPVPGEPSPTSTTAATLAVETPEGGYVSTAQPCGEPPTVQARGLVNVRLGPGLDYDPIDSLVYLEVRPIIGRAEFATWWLIQLPGNTTGWVADQAVGVQGYTGAVPIVEPPEINGATPTPGPLWDPTPNPSCTPVPTSTATNTPEIEEAAPTVSNISNTTPTRTPVLPTATEEPATNTPEPTLEPTSVPATSTSAPTIDAGAANSGGPVDEDNGDSGSSASTWILLVGVGLVIVGAVSFVLRGR